MLYFVFPNDQCVGWHTGEPKPVLVHNMPEAIVEIQADGDELSYIKALIPGVPQVNANVVNYPNPWAALIVANLFKHAKLAD